LASVYLDHNASTPLDERVLEAMLPYLTTYHGNASSRHEAGRFARAAIDRAREQVAALVGASPAQVIFTSGGTEANNLVLKGLTLDGPPGRIIVSAIEHPSIRGPAYRLRRSGWEVVDAHTDLNGRVDTARLHQVLEESANSHTRLVSIMMANNETGVVQDIAALAAEVRAFGALMHTDAVQAAGKVPVDFPASDVHAMSLSAHKLNGPKGVGALVVDKSIDLAPLLDGGGQEKGLRGGTENVAGIVGFGMAAEIAMNELEGRRTAMAALRERLEARLSQIPTLVIFGQGAARLPNTVMFAVPGIDGEALVMALNRAGFAVSSGSACSSHENKVSHVLLAMGVAPELAQGSVRVSLGSGNTGAQVEAFVGTLRNEIRRLQAMVASRWA
jgi:cysteine desulfurase